MRERGEAAKVLTDSLSRLRSLSWDELDVYGKHTEEVTTPSGRQFEVVTMTFWDMERWASGMYLIAKARPRRGWRRVHAYKESDVLIVPASLHRDNRPSP
jgi:hypothetical protein